MVFRSLLEPIRTSNPFASFFEASCDAIDLEHKVVTCTSAFAYDGGARPRFQVPARLAFGLPPSPPLLVAPVRPSPPPQPGLHQPPQAIRSQTSLRITFFGLDLWSLCTWNSDIQAMIDRQQQVQPSTNLTLQYLTAPGICYSHLKTLDYTALLNTNISIEQLMPGLDYLVADVTQVLRDYFIDKSLDIQTTNYCAGNRTVATFYTTRPATPVTSAWPTLNVMVTITSRDPEGQATLTTTRQLGNLQRNCRGAFSSAGPAFFEQYQMPIQRCLVEQWPVHTGFPARLMIEGTRASARYLYLGCTQGQV
ncbi:FAD NAD(P)-binding domain-containing [Haematococcus lacustris]|uniref:FAD NAD(P)-binding domain-containing n=1 Tax=Haematococcus lacustris TaxID=44745 RepID=A0A6A0AFW4_HAELA|nr:FAD NAD(P)-binding domain-containing [Haematococcus lacustris]